jgi:small subunit ribosomal protein S9
LNDKGYYYATGRRKNAVARVRLTPGAGAIVINGKPYEELFPQERLRKMIAEPLLVTDSTGKFSVSVKVSGGGYAGQAGAISHGIAKALLATNEGLRSPLRKFGMLTRDSRIKERKKYGLVRARKAKQYTKR